MSETLVDELHLGPHHPAHQDAAHPVVHRVRKGHPALLHETALHAQLGRDRRPPGACGSNCTPPMMTSVSALEAIASGTMYSSFRILLPPNASPELQSSRLAQMSTLPPSRSERRRASRLAWGRTSTVAFELSEHWRPSGSSPCRRSPSTTGIPACIVRPAVDATQAHQRTNEHPDSIGLVTRQIRHFSKCAMALCVFHRLIPPSPGAHQGGRIMSFLRFPNVVDG